MVETTLRFKLVTLGKKNQKSEVLPFVHN